MMHGQKNVKLRNIVLPGFIYSWLRTTNMLLRAP